MRAAFTALTILIRKPPKDCAHKIALRFVWVRCYRALFMHPLVTCSDKQHSTSALFPRKQSSRRAELRNRAPQIKFQSHQFHISIALPFLIIEFRALTIDESTSCPVVLLHHPTKPSSIGRTGGIRMCRASPDKLRPSRRQSVWSLSTDVVTGIIIIVAVRPNQEMTSGGRRLRERIAPQHSLCWLAWWERCGLGRIVGPGRWSRRRRQGQAHPR